MATRRILPPTPEKLEPDISLFIVNIVLLLILFFLATGQIMNGTPVEERLALTRDLPLDLLPQPLLEIRPSGDLTLNGEAIEDDALLAALGDNTDLFVLIDRAVDASRLVDVLARPDLAIYNIELVTIANRSGEDGG